MSETECLTCGETFDDGTCAYEVSAGTYLDAGFENEGLVGYIHPWCTPGETNVIRMKVELLDEILACQNFGQIFPILKRAQAAALREAKLCTS